MTMSSLNTIANGAPISATPVQANFATIAAYVDADLLNKDGSVAVSGTADLTLGRSPSSALHATTKGYVDSLDTATRSYADGLDTATRSYADGLDTATRSYADGLDTATRSYVDGLVPGALTIQAVTYTGTTDTLALTDASQLLIYTNSAQVTVTIPANGTVAFDVGTRIVLFSTGAGGLTVNAGAVTLLASASPKVTIGSGEALYLEKTATNSWAVIGGTS